MNATIRTLTDPLSVYADFDTSQANPSTEQTAASAYTGAPRDVVADITQTVRSLREELHALVIDLYNHPETGFAEHRSAGRIADLLESHGVTVQRGIFGLPTSFTATAGGTDGPHFAVVAEYDALPGIGHACGHNVIAGIAVGAFLALSKVVSRIGGRVSLIGAPAEEGGAGKELIIRAGGFDDVDAAGMVHPGIGKKASPIFGSGTSGVRRVAVTYHGRAAHAALSPYLGLNALDAVVTAYQSIAQLRQHILPIDRVHGVITDGGSAANVVPEKASALFLIRSTDTPALRVLTERVVDVLEAAALSTGTKAEITVDTEPPYLPLDPNTELNKRFAAHLTGLGWDVPIRPATVRLGGPSTDMGNVSQYVPAIHPALGLGGDGTVVPHNPSFADITILDPAIDSLVDAAISLAGTAADFLSDKALRSAVEAEFQRAGGRRRWEN